MFAVKIRFAGTALVCAIALTSCGKKDDAPKGGDEPKPTLGPTPPGPIPPGPTPKQPDPRPKQPTQESLASVKPDFSFTAEQWRSQHEGYFPPYEKYQGKVIELKGVVEYGEPGHLHLKAGTTVFDAVTCRTLESEPWKKAFPGQRVVLRAKIDGVVSWEILDVKGPTPDKFTAEELARAVASDAKGMEKRYEGKYIIVSGVIQKADTDESDFTRITLKSAESLAPVTFGFAGTSDDVRKRNKSFRPGMKLTVLGQYDGTALKGRCEVMELTP